MFRNWDFERGVLAFMALLIVAGIGFIFWQDAAAGELQQKLGTAESQLSQIGQLADQVLTLQADMAKDSVASNKIGPDAYIERQMIDSKIGKKFNRQAPVTEPHPNDGYEDVKYAYVPAQKDFIFDRHQIATWMLYIEGNTTRMKVTHITLDLAQGKNADGDTWTPRVTITDRHPVAKP